MAPILWHLEVSHFSEKARWALDYKRVVHERRTPLPGLHRLTALALTRGAHDRLPVLGLEGRRIGDSTAIIAALETHRPDPPLYPGDPERRRRALALEEHFDEQLAPRLRRLFWHHTLGDTEATLRAAMPSAGPARRRVMRVLAPVAVPIVRRDYDVREATAADALEGVRAALDRVERELGGGDYLVGDSFTIADLTAAALFTPVLAPPQRPYAPDEPAPALLELRAELSARPGGAWVAEMYARHRGEWIRPADG
jgi:glutathione S-transferase